MSRRSRPLPSPTPDDPSVCLTSAERWVALFGSQPPQQGKVLIERAIAWQEQVLAAGDVAPAILSDLAIVAHQTRVARLGQQSAEEAGPGASCAVPAKPEPGSMRQASDDGAPESAACAVPVQATRGAMRQSAAPRRPRLRPAPLPPASSQLRVGARLVKIHKGVTHVVEVTDDGMRYQDQMFASLSAVARHITGTHWNGLLFFGLRRRKTYPDRQASRG